MRRLSDDLRNTIGSIASSVELLLEDRDAFEPEQVKFLSIIEGHKPLRNRAVETCWTSL